VKKKDLVFRFALPPSTALEAFGAEVGRLRTYLTNALGRTTDVTVSRSYEILERNILSGAVDAAWAPPFVCARTEPEGAEVIVRTVRRGRSSYCSALLTRKHEGGSLASLRGKRAAWVDPHSVAGYLLPVAHLRKNGYEPRALFAQQMFAGSYPGALGAVLEEKADVAAVHCLDGDEGALAESLKVAAPGFEDEFALIALTDATPSDGVVLGPRGETKRDALERALLAMPKVAPDVIEEIFHAEGFELAEKMAYRALYAVAPRDA
jgi:phosphonate transport system substrate-binding protein